MDAAFVTQLTIRDGEHPEVESTATRYDSELVGNARLPGAGVYHVIIETEDSISGDWNLMVTHGGAGRWSDPPDPRFRTSAPVQPFGEPVRFRDQVPAPAVGIGTQKAGVRAVPCIPECQRGPGS